MGPSQEQDIFFCKTEHEFEEMIREIDSWAVMPQTLSFILDTKDNIYKDLVETPEVARIAHVKQLGVAQYCPELIGASHTRYAHSLVFATKMDYLAQKFGLDRKLSVATGILHDIGSAPMSDSIGKAARISDEAYFEKILENSKHIPKVLEKHGISKKGLVEIVTGKDSSVIGRLANSSDSIDVDRWSYVNMDGWHTHNLPKTWKGSYISDPFKSADVREGKIVFTDLKEVGEFLEGRTQMFEKVYRNENLMAREAFMGQLLQKIEKHVELTPEYLLRIGDDTFVGLAREFGGELACSIFGINHDFDEYGQLNGDVGEVESYMRKVTDRPFAVTRHKPTNTGTGALVAIDGQLRRYREWEPEHAEEMGIRLSDWNHATVYGYKGDHSAEDAFAAAYRKFGSPIKKSKLEPYTRRKHGQ